MSIRKRNGRRWAAIFGIFVAVFVFTFLMTKYKDNNVADAANLREFDPGYIMSDYQMGNYNSMSEAEIWNFLKQKGNCNDTRTYLADQYTSYSYHIKDGHFVCLADETFGEGTAYGDGAPNGASAAHIIWQAAQDYRINPQVLIVLLQKEQGLITDSWPNNRQYRSATGYGCPDTAACDSKYYGFKNQVRQAASMFRAVLDGGWTNYPLGNNYIQYNPNSSCGGSVVNIRSLATSALYRYTPYQPNSAALNAGYGTGDSCSAYGNRNFYSYFEDWFGEIMLSEFKSQGKTINDGLYQFISVENSKKAIDVEGKIGTGAVSGQTAIYDRKTFDMDSQTFEIKYDYNNGYYSITSPESELAFDVEGGSLSNGAQIILWQEHDGCNQDWVIEPNGNEEYTIISRCSGKVLDAKNSNDLISYERNSGKNQRWVLARVSDNEDRIIEDGVYQVFNKTSEKVIDIEGGVSSNMTSGKLDVYSISFLKLNTMRKQDIIKLRILQVA